YVAFGVISRLTATAVYSRFTARWASNASTLSPSATSISRPFTVIFMETKTAAPPSRVRPRLFASCSLRPHYRDQVRGVPGRTRFSGILPPRRQGEYTPAPFDLTGAGCYLVRHSSRPPSTEESAPMTGTTRRQFLKTSAATSTALATWLALDRAPALGQKRELTLLSWNHFVPASDDELRKQAEAFSKAAGVSVRVDTIAHLQLMAKFAAEAQSQSGHDMIRTHDAIPFLFESQLGDVGDVVDKLGKQHGGWYSFAAEACQTKSGWRAVPWFWISFPATYN